MKRVYCGNEKGDVYELRTEVRGRNPVWNRVHGSEDMPGAVASLYVDEAKCILYALYDDSAIEAFAYRQGESARRVAGFRSEHPVSFVELFPIISKDPDTAHLMGVAADGSLFNFQLDLHQIRRTFSFVKKLLRTAPAAPVTLNLVHQTASLAPHLETGVSEDKKLLGVGLFEGLVMAVTHEEENRHAIDLYSISRVPVQNEEPVPEPANASFIKEPIRLDGQFVSMQLAADDDTTRLFEGLDLGVDELSHQVFIKGQKFMILTGTKVIDVRKRAPVEILMEILQVHNPEHLDAFFNLYGPFETATMAVQLAASRGDEHSKRLLVDDPRLSTMISNESNTSGELSIPARAILNYFRRLVEPLWKKSLFFTRTEGNWKRDGTKMESVLSMPLLDWFGNSLEELEKFITSYVEEFQAIQFYDRSVYVPKCPNMLPEFELLFELKDVIIKCREILSLVKIFKEEKPVNLSEHQIKTYEKATFESLAFMKETPKSPLQTLIAAILSNKEPEVKEAIVYRMDIELPELCNTKDKIFQKVRLPHRVHC